ncbi:hypothetical protein C7M84_010368 [Penaeus vannamei]|uniref:RING-type domain-containing protein n=1 Tax=Penaeus vannamei TaxID=6689 RepID=A0A423T522_PENVA|nr:hypothetical protein C7M84_010368 [Penaeus vannamei]
MSPWTQRKRRVHLPGAMAEESADREQSSGSWRTGLMSRTDDDSPDDPDNSDGEIPAGLQCAVCLRKYNTKGRRPIILAHCGHTFCRKCLETENRQTVFKCPSCRQSNDMFSRLPTNFAVLSLLEMNLAQKKKEKEAKETEEKKEREEKEKKDKSAESSDLASSSGPLSERPRTEERDARGSSSRVLPYTSRQEHRRYDSRGLDFGSDLSRRGSTRDAGESGRSYSSYSLAKKRLEEPNGTRRLSTWRRDFRSDTEYRSYGRYGDLETRQLTYGGARPRPYRWSNQPNLQNSRESLYGSTRDAATGRSNRFQLTASERAKLRQESKDTARSHRSWRRKSSSSSDSSDDELLGACGGSSRRRFSSDEDSDLSQDLGFSKGKKKEEAKEEAKSTARDEWKDQWRRDVDALLTRRKVAGAESDADDDLLYYVLWLSQQEAEREEVRREEERRRERQREEERRKREREEGRLRWEIEEERWRKREREEERRRKEREEEKRRKERDEERKRERLREEERKKKERKILGKKKEISWKKGAREEEGKKLKKKVKEKEEEKKESEREKERRKLKGKDEKGRKPVKKEEKGKKPERKEEKRGKGRETGSMTKKGRESESKKDKGAQGGKERKLNSKKGKSVERKGEEDSEDYTKKREKRTWKTRPHPPLPLPFHCRKYPSPHPVLDIDKR